jgi:regulator of sigma E protease
VWLAGFQEGDRIVEMDGQPIQHTLDFSRILQEEPASLKITYVRNGLRNSVTLKPEYVENAPPTIGLTFAINTYRSPRLGPIRAVGKGVAEAGSIMALTIKSIGLLFRGVSVRESLTGPVRINYYVGEIASQSFKSGLGSGFSNMFRFLSLLSVAVFFMNLLPIPALDGGLIILFIIEMIQGRSLRPKVVYRYQIIGITIILGIFIFATLNDVFFLAKG